MDPNDTVDINDYLTIAQGHAAINGSILSPSSLQANAMNTIMASIPQNAVEERMDKFALNRVSIDHKVAAHELLALQAANPAFAEEIKETIAKSLARDITKKITFTKRHNMNTDVHHFIGRVWVFTDEELKQIIKG